jgi:hypothetical protein
VSEWDLARAGKAGDAVIPMFEPTCSGKKRKGVVVRIAREHY